MSDRQLTPQERKAMEAAWEARSESCIHAHDILEFGWRAGRAFAPLPAPPGETALRQAEQALVEAIYTREADCEHCKERINDAADGLRDALDAPLEPTS